MSTTRITGAIASDKGLVISLIIIILTSCTCLDNRRVGTAHQHNNQLFKLQSAVPTLHPKALLTLGARSEYQESGVRVIKNCPEAACKLV
jgi:hypothetical protein